MENWSEADDFFVCVFFFVCRKKSCSLIQQLKVSKFLKIEKKIRFSAFVYEDFELISRKIGRRAREKYWVIREKLPNRLINFFEKKADFSGEGKGKNG